MDKQPPPFDRTAAEEKLRAMHEHRRAADPIDRIEQLIHPEAEMRLLVSFGKPLHGRTAVIKTLEHARQAAVYLAEVRGFEWLDEHTALTSAQARYPLEGGGFAEGTVFWLDELRDGLIWRVQAFRSEAEARRAYDDRFEARTKEH
jgi:hypothetical protein